MGAFAQDFGRTVRPRQRSDLLAGGLSPRTLASSQWRQVAHGWHVQAGVAASPAQRIVQTAAILVEGSLSGWAAGYVLGADALDGQDPFTGRAQPVRVVLPAGSSYRSVPGARAVRADLEPDEVAQRHGLTLTGPSRTAYDLAREAAGLTEAVVALDALVRSETVDLETVRRVVGSATDARGARQARQAADLCRRGVRSTWETRLRMFVLEQGLPEPEVNVPVFDLEGRFLGAPDLLDLEAGFAMEFDGAGHRERRRHRADNVREEGLEHAGLVVARADSLDLTVHRSDLARRLRVGRLAALQNPRPRRWTIVEPSWWQGLPA